MLFSSIIFISVFLPLVLLSYFLCPAKLKNALLLCFSLLFYSWGEKWLVIIMIAMIAVNFFAGKLIEKGYRKSGLIISIVSSFGALFFYKYFNFTFDNLGLLLSAFGVELESIVKIPKIIMPIGISFYTFQTVSYVIDVYRKEVKAAHNIIDFATYVSFFPQLIAGPIVRYSDIQFQLENRKTDSTYFAKGIERFILGLAKKIIIANNFAFIADTIFNTPYEYVDCFTAWIGILSYAIQIYYDFSAYSDMAIGLGWIFGFRFLENFEYPYTAQSIKEFWRRWHISLSTWFRDYVYIPLGGNKKGPFRTYLNLFIVFFVTGLWHGASWNFIVWGLFHGAFLVLERLGGDTLLKRMFRPLRHIYTLLVVLIGWVFFRCENLEQSLIFLGRMFGISAENQVYNPSYFLTANNILWFVIALCFCLPLFPYFQKRIHAVVPKSIILRSVYRFAILVLLLFCLSYVAVDTYNPFIYFRF